MRAKRKYRLTLITLGLVALGAIVALVAYALRQNINLFYTPSDVVVHGFSDHRVIRLGGLVKEGTVARSEQNLNISFTLTDMQADVTVQYTGILPDLFREGQGIIAEGKLDPKGVFQATQVLAKHDENYMPPQLAEKLKHDS